MPNQRHGKVRHLLKGNKAKVVKRTPLERANGYITEREVRIFLPCVMGV